MDKMFQINDVSQKCGDVVQHAEKFLPFAQQRMGFNKPVSINLLSDPENAKNPLGKTAYYDPEEMKIVVFVDKRHVKDIMRSLSHELVHHTQNCRGDLSGNNYTGPGYAQKDKHMRKMEGEAYLMGNLCFRDWEDSLKKENSEMNEAKLRKYVKNLITEALDEQKLKMVDNPKGPGKVPFYAADGKGKMEEEDDPVQETDEGQGEKLEEAEGLSLKLDELPLTVRKMAEELGLKGPFHSNKSIKEDAINEIEKELRMRLKRKEKREETNENWHKGNKDQLLFEKLVKKWTK